MSDEKKNSVLLVDDEKLNIIALTQILSSEYVIYAANTGEMALDTARKYLPDVILLDIIMPEMDGYCVITAIKADEATKDIPVIFVTGLTNPKDEEKGLMLGAADYINKPFSPAIVRLRVRNQIKMLNQLSLIAQLSVIDQLTAIPNRRGFDNRMELEWWRAVRDKNWISLMIIDTDLFKDYNDTYGHLQGDTALQAVARIVQSAAKRPGDYAARWGGEEFVLLLADTDEESSLLLAENIRAAVENENIPCVGGISTKITVSIGVNTIVPKTGQSCDKFIADADKALYRAKQSGRNKVCQVMFRIKAE